MTNNFTLVNKYAIYFYEKDSMTTSLSNVMFQYIISEHIPNYYISLILILHIFNEILEAKYVSLSVDSTLDISYT